jgi:hypothetical protein
MAAREGQGLQIAVIIFAMLTIILAITTYIFYAQSQTAAKERDEKTAAAQQAQKQANEYLYRLRAYQYVLGRENATLEMVNTAKGAVGQDAEVDTLLKEFESDKALVGSQVAEGQAANYRTLAMILLSAVTRKNSSVTDANDQVTKVQTDKTAAETRDQGKVAAADAAVKKAEGDLAAERDQFNTEKGRMATQNAGLQTQLAAKEKTYKDQIERLERDREILSQEQAKQIETIGNLQQQRKQLQSEQVNLFESPDGEVKWVNQRQRLVWIDVGRGDGLMRQTTFSVFDHDINGVTNAKSKGRIEVVRLTDEHMAECSILEDTPANPILPGDVIHTPTWSPGQRLHFAMAGVMDIDGDRVDDYDVVRNIITLNGGVIDAELKPDGTRTGKMDVNTRYLVLGAPPDETSTDRALSEFKKIHDEVSRYGTDIIPVQKLLTQMGWKAEERTVEMTGGGGSAFRTRKPGQKPMPKPGTAAPAPAAEPMPEPAAPGADPFGAPPAADPFAPPKPAAPAAPAGDAADPFAPPGR